MELNDDIISSFKPSKVFKNSEVKVVSISFSNCGNYLLSLNLDSTLILFNIKLGTQIKLLNSFKYGINKSIFTHSKSNIIHNSTKLNHHLRYLSLHDNNYLRYFKGHSQQVTSLQLSPSDDTFISAAIDDTVRLWDIRSENSSGLLNIAGRPVVAYDPSSIIFAVALNLISSTSISLYDLRNYDSAPFATVILPPSDFNNNIITNIIFSNDGTKILLATEKDTHYVLDAFEYTIIAKLKCPSNIMGLSRSIIAPYQESYTPRPNSGISGQEVSWTPDSRYVISGAIDGQIHTWDLNPSHFDPQRPLAGPECVLFPIKSLSNYQGKGEPTRCVAFNPKHAMMASASHDLVFWLPDPAEYNKS